MNSLDRLHIELAAIDTAISDRGVAEKDCTLPLAERISNIISELKEWRHKCSVAEAENERLRAVRDAGKSFIDVFDQTEIDAGASDLSTRERELLDRLRAAISRLDAAAGGA